jgi:MoCo/4Fe-4S cofactor protein with predicted Tat translocation signal
MDGMREKDDRTLKPGQSPALPVLGHTDHEEEHEQENPAVREHALDLAAVRAKLNGKSGKQYWRTLEELAEDPHFEDLLHREFPRQASEWDESVDRRNFLKLAPPRWPSPVFPAAIRPTILSSRT